MGGAGPSAGSTGADFAPDWAGRAPPFFGVPRVLAERLAEGAAWAAGMTGAASKARITGMSSQEMSDQGDGALPPREARDSCLYRRQQAAARAAGGLGRGAEAPGVKYGSMLWS